MPQLPTGTVTLLFTDIEGSTRLLQELGRDEYVRALEAHRQLLRDAFTAHGGVEVEMQGDSFHFAFETAQKAVEAAAVGQRALAAYPWPDEALRVRIGLHTGTPMVSEGLYAGLDVHRAARVMQAAHGGQVLLSEQTARLLEASDELALVDLGERRLKDLIEPLRLYQLAGEGLEKEFPPPNTLETRKTNLPVQPTPLVGRERELMDVRELIGREGVRLVTLTGPGGSGKTRLALQTAAESIDDYMDGVWFVNLAALTDPDLVVPTIAHTLGLTEQPGQPIAQTLTEWISPREPLLVLDNFEQVLDAAPSVAELLAHAERLKLIVTSRAPLHLSGEHEWPVPPLASEEALALFVARAQAAKPSFSLNGNRPVVIKICRRLDRLPLAIELAAARIKLLSEQALLERLDQKLKLLTGGARDLDERQRTLRATIDWSYELLSEEEKILFRRLSVFAGGRTLEAIEAVCNPDGELDVFEAVSSLLDKSLLRRETTEDGEARFVMLETIHDYAREKLDESREADEFRRRHAEFFLALAKEAEEGLRGAEQARWNDRLEVEEDNTRRALRWALASEDARVALGIAGGVHRFWFVRGRFEEGLNWLRQAVRIDAPHADALRAYALHALANLAIWNGRDEEALQAAEASLALSEPSGDSRTAARALNALGMLALLRGELEEAAQLYERCRKAAEDAVDSRYMGMAIANLGDVALAAGDYARAEELTEEALSRVREAGAKEMEALGLFNLSQIAFRRGDHERARALIQSCAALGEELGMKHVQVVGLIELAAIADREENHRRAAILAKAAKVHGEAMGLRFGPNETSLQQATLASAAAQLTPEDLEAVEQEAQTLDLADAFALDANHGR